MVRDKNLKYARYVKHSEFNECGALEALEAFDVALTSTLIVGVKHQEEMLKFFAQEMGIRAKNLKSLADKVGKELGLFEKRAKR